MYIVHHTFFAVPINWSKFIKMRQKVIVLNYGEVIPTSSLFCILAGVRKRAESSSWLLKTIRLIEQCAEKTLLQLSTLGNSWYDFWVQFLVFLETKRKKIVVLQRNSLFSFLVGDLVLLIATFNIAHLVKSTTRLGSRGFIIRWEVRVRGNKVTLRADPCPLSVVRADLVKKIGIH